MNQELKEAIDHILNEELVKAKNIIESRLYQKMGVLLEDTLMEYAPTIFEKKMKDPEDKDGDGDRDEDGDKDKTDEWAAKRDAAIKKNMNEKNCEDGDCGDDKKSKEDEEDDEEEEDMEDDEEEKEMNEAFDEFTEYLTSIVEQIEEETGEELTEEQILEIAESLLTENIDEEELEEE